MRRSLVFRILLALFLLAGAGLLVLVWLGRDPEQKFGPQPGERAPDLELTDTSGRSIRLADFRAGGGKPGSLAILTFWSPTCPTGRRHLPCFAALAAWCQEQGVEFVAVDSYGDDTAKAAALAREHGATYPVFMDESTAVAKALGARTVTSTWLVDRDGVIRYRGALDNGKEGPDRVFPAAIAAREILDGKPVSSPKQPPSG